jgi:hypothetical protein
MNRSGSVGVIRRARGERATGRAEPRKSRTHSDGGTDIEIVCLCWADKEREKEMEISKDGRTDRQTDRQT